MLIHIILVIIAITVNGVFIKPQRNSAKVIAVEDRHRSFLDASILKTGSRYGVVLIDKEKCSDVSKDKNVCYWKSCRYKCIFETKPVKDGNTTLDSSIYYVKAPFEKKKIAREPLLLCADWSLTHRRRFVRVFSDKEVIHNKNEVHAECHWNSTRLSAPYHPGPQLAPPASSDLSQPLLESSKLLLHPSSELVLHYRGIRNTKWEITNHDTTKIPRIASGILMMDTEIYSVPAAKSIMRTIIVKQSFKSTLMSISSIATGYGIIATPLLATIFVVRTIKEAVQTQGVTALKPEQAQAKLIGHVNISKTDIYLDKTTGYLAQNEIACIRVNQEVKLDQDTGTYVSIDRSNRTGKCVGIHDRSRSLKVRWLKQQAYAIMVTDSGDCKNPSKTKIYCEFTYEAIGQSGITVNGNKKQDLSVRLFYKMPDTGRKAYLCTCDYSNGKNTVRYVEIREEDTLEIEGPNCEWTMVKTDGSGGDGSAFLVWKEKGDTNDLFTISSNDMQFQVKRHPRILMAKNNKKDTTELAKIWASKFGSGFIGVTIIGGLGVVSHLSVGIIPVIVGVGAGAINALSRPADTFITNKGRSDAEFTRRLATEDQDKPNVSSYLSIYGGIIGTAIIVVLVGSIFIYAVNF